MSVAISFNNVSKLYRLGARRTSIRQLLSANRIRQQTSPDSGLKALDNVTFDIGQGECVGLIGANGAGKTTALKLLSRVSAPSTGSINVNGRLSALIQLGAGFHPDLTGRDNIYLNGAILGLSRNDIRRRFDEIVAFSELESFIDTPVKRYSSGMYARLGFSVAVHVSPDILIVDEVLAVGDTSFQHKCLRSIRDVAQSGRTVVFVSHNLDAVQGLCKRVLWLDHGHLRLDGNPTEVINSYLIEQEKEFLAQDLEAHGASSDQLRLTHVEMRDEDGRVTREFRSGASFTVDIHYHARTSIPAPYFSVGVSDQDSGMLFLASMLIDGNDRSDLTGSGVITCRFTGISLMPKAYQLWGSVRDEYGLSDLVGWHPIGAFRIVSLPTAIASEQSHLSIAHLKTDASIYVSHEWGTKGWGDE